MSLPQDNIYLQRINAVIDHIRADLSEDMALNSLAKIAGFSPFHFHRIFSGLMGETLADFVARLRLERAAALMKADPSLKITDAAFAAGFRALASFSRAFRKRYGLAASQWDRKAPLKERKNDQAFEGLPHYTDDMLGEMAGQFPVTVRPFRSLTVAYIRVVDSYKPDRMIAAVERLTAWARARGLDPLTRVAIGMSQDDPDVTPLHLYQYDVCMSVPEDWRGEGEVSVRVLPSCTLASIRVQGDIFKVDQAWQYLFRYWLPRSRYLPDNLPAMEIFHRQPAEIGWETFDMDAALPIVRM